jgi:hypothetical protein
MGMSVSRFLAEFSSVEISELIARDRLSNPEYRARIERKLLTSEADAEQRSAQIMKIIGG